MSENFKPWLEILSFRAPLITSVGDYEPPTVVLGNYEIPGKRQREVVACRSRDPRNCSECPLKDICPLPYGVNLPRHRAVVPRERLEPYVTNLPEEPRNSNFLTREQSHPFPF